jgi:hypothetical protein
MGKLAWIPLIGAAGLVVGAAGSWWAGDHKVDAYPRAPLRHPTRSELLSMQQRADNACRCARDRGGGPAARDCWTDLDRSLSLFDRSEPATACMDDSVSLICFGPDPTRGPCIFTQRAHESCSAEEAARRESEARARHEQG